MECRLTKRPSKYTCYLSVSTYNSFPVEISFSLMVKPALSNAVDELENSQTVKLISSDDCVFTITRKAALASGTIKNMLSSPGFDKLKTRPIL